MIKTLLPALILFATAATSTSSLAGDPPSNDLARLQGRWTAKAGPLRDIAVELQIDGHKVRVDITTSQGLAVHASGELKIDETSSPRALDWTKFISLDHQELPDIQAIYAIDGDTFKVCNGGPNGSRPTEFKPGDGVLADVVVFKRTEPKTTTSTVRSTAPGPVSQVPDSRLAAGSRNTP